jgi:hypothetical protein
MTKAGNSQITRTITLLITIVSLSLPAYAQYSGGTGEPDDPYQIATAEDLITLGETTEDYDKHFILTADIDLDPNLPGRKVFDRAVIAPDTDDSKVDFQGDLFTGIFDGSGYTISHLTIKGDSYLGLFGQAGSGAIISNLGLKAADINGISDSIGGLVGDNGYGSSITSCFSAGSVSGDGGLVGYNSGSITSCYTTGVVSGKGGLVGSTYYGSNISNCYSTATVNGQYGVGGLVGYNLGSITSCYSAGSVSGDEVIGGLVGTNFGTITRCYSHAIVTGESTIGGLVGKLDGYYSMRGDVCGTISNSYSAGVVDGTDSAGGLVGYTGIGSISNSFWDIETSGQATSDRGIGKTTAEMQTTTTFLNAGWDFIDETVNGPNDIWKISEGLDYPRLWWEKYGGGTGEPNNPYLIYTAEHLNEMSAEPNDWDKHFKLMADIDLSGFVYDRAVIAPDMKDAERGFQGTTFNGVFDGNGNTISHLLIEGYSYLGLFGELSSGASITNLGLEVVDVNGTGRFVGGLVGANGESAWSLRAGGYISRCYSTGEVSGNTRIGGLVGYNIGDLTNCYSTVAVKGEGSLGGLVGCNDSDFPESGMSRGRVGAITRCYSTGQVTGISFVGGLVGTQSPFANVEFSFWDIETSGLPNMCGRDEIDARWDHVCDDSYGRATAEMQTVSTFLEAGWDFAGETSNGTEDIWWIIEGKDYPHLWWEESTTPTAPYGGGSGEPNDPYLIGTAEELISLGRRPWDYGKHFILTDDIDLNINLPWWVSLVNVVIGGTSFTGVFDGDGHTISNLKVGLFGSLGSGAEVRDLGVVDVNISSGYGSISADNNGNITNCYCTGTIRGFGGLVGYNYGDINQCYSTCTHIGGNGGGLVGENGLGGNITASYNTGTVSGGEVGGLVGSNYGNVTQNHSTGSVSGTGGDIGGLVGRNGGTVTQCFSTGAVSATGDAISDIGGLVGYNSGGVIQCYSTGTVSAIGELLTFCVGGLVGGGNDGNVIQCYSTGLVSATGQFTAGIGGLVGRDSTVTKSVWDIETSGLSESAGGVGLTTTEMQTAQTFLEAGWDFVDETENGTDDIWWIDEGQDYPRLWWEIGDETSP